MQVLGSCKSFGLTVIGWHALSLRRACSSVLRKASERATPTSNLGLQFCYLVLCVLFSFGLAMAADDPARADDAGKPLATSTVGIAKRVDSVILPGTKLQVKPMADRHQPFVMRIINTYPHGTDHRYDVEFYALEPGTYNLSEYLVPAVDSVPAADSPSSADNQNAVALPAVMVRVDATLPAGQIAPLPLGETPIPWLGGYRLMWLAGGALWLVGLYGLLFYGRKQSIAATEAIAPTLSLADRLRPLVQAARDKQLAPEQRAALERTLIAFWCKRLNLGATAPAQVMSTLREHAEAGPLVRSLEDWLHRPDAPQSVDIDALLKPYADVVDGEVQESEATHNKHRAQQGAPAV